MSELPVQIESLLKKYGKKIERIVHERSEEEVQEARIIAKQLDGAVGVIAKGDGKFVLVRHTPESWGDASHYWAFPGGGVEHDEDFEEAAIREFREEAGLDVELTGLLSVHEHVERSPRGSRLVFYVATFEGEVVGGEMRPEKPNEISEVRLFEELPEKDLVPWLRETYSMFKRV